VVVAGERTFEIPARSMIAAGMMVLALMLAAPLYGGEQLTIRGVIKDVYGHPLPGAGLYVEAWVGNGHTYDFAFATAGARGEVPPEGAPPMTISWVPGMKLAYTALEKDKDPQTRFDRMGVMDPGNVEFVLADADPSYPWSLKGLSYPFDDNPALAKKAAAPEYARMREMLSAFARERKGPSQASAPKIRLPKTAFAWGEPIPLEILFTNDSDRTVYRENPDQSPKTVLRIESSGAASYSFSRSLSKRQLAVVWNGRGPYPIPELALAPDETVRREADLVTKILAGRSKDIFRPGAYACWVEDRNGKSNRLKFSVEYKRESIPALLKTVKDAKADSKRRAWAAMWLADALPPHLKGYFNSTGSKPWESVDKATVKAEEAKLQKAIDKAKKWYDENKNSAELIKLLDQIAKEYVR